MKSPTGEGFTVELRPAATEGALPAGDLPEWVGRWLWHFVRHRGHYEVVVRKHVGFRTMFFGRPSDMPWAVVGGGSLQAALVVERETIDRIRAGGFEFAPP